MQALGFIMVFAVFGCGDDERSGSDDGGSRADGGTAADGGAPGTDAFLPGGDAALDDGGGAAADAGRTGDSGPAGGASPDAPGAFSVTRSTDTVADATAEAFVPTLVAGERAPLVVLKHGFQLSTADYAVLAERIASHGFVVVGTDTAGGFSGPTNIEERDATIAVIDFATSSAPYASSVDATRVAVIGHSRGGKVAVMIAAEDPRVGAVLLLDPVNGCGPGTGYSASCPDVTSADLAGSLELPVGVMGETNNASGGFMPCAPADQNYQTIFDALARATWAVEWTFTGADHMDFTDTGGGFAGSFCPDGPGDDEMIRGAVRAMAVAFVRLHLGGEAAMTEWLAGASLPPGIERDGP